MRSRPLGTDLSPDEAATVARFDAAPDAEESLRERVAQAMHTSGCGPRCDVGPTARHYKDADAALAVMRGTNA